MFFNILLSPYIKTIYYIFVTFLTKKEVSYIKSNTTYIVIKVNLKI